MNILVVGGYLPDHPNTKDHLEREFAASSHQVEQRWMAAAEKDDIPKFAKLNRLLAQGIDGFDMVICSDDDIYLPDGFLDGYLGAIEACGFTLAQPARSRESYFWHEVTRQQDDYARETRFVEIGPLFTVTSEAFEHVFPFDESSPWGWGYEFVWAKQLKDAGQKMGVIDAYPVDHTLRPHGQTFDYQEASSHLEPYLDKHPHLSREECMVNLHVFEAATAAIRRDG